MGKDDAKMIEKQNSVAFNTDISILAENGKGASALIALPPLPFIPLQLLEVLH